MTEHELDKRQVGNNYLTGVLSTAPIICSLMVVILHQHNSFGSLTSTSSRIISFFTHGLCTAAVPTFFLISGYLFYKNVNSVHDVFQKQRRRIASLLMPFLAWSTFYYAFYAIISIIFPTQLQTTVDVSPIAIIKGIFFYEYAFLLWYLFQLCIYVFLLAPAIFCVLKNNKAKVILFCFVLLTALFIKDDITLDLGRYQRNLFQFNFFCYYLLGCYLTECLASVKKIVESIPTFIFGSAFIFFGFIGSLIYDGIIPCYYSRSMVPLITLSFWGLMLRVLGNRKIEKSIPVSTMIIYGIHPLAGLLVNRFVLSRVHHLPLLHFGLSVIMVTALSFALGYILKQFKPIYRVFSGNR